MSERHRQRNDIAATKREAGAFVQFLRNSSTVEDIKKSLEDAGYHCLIKRLPSKGFFALIYRLEPNPIALAEVGEFTHTLFWKALKRLLSRRRLDRRLLVRERKDYADPAAREARLRRFALDQARNEILAQITSLRSTGSVRVPRFIFIRDHLAGCPCVQNEKISLEEAAELADAILLEEGLEWPPEPDPRQRPRTGAYLEQFPYGDYPGHPWS